MDTIITWSKENFNLVLLLVSIAGVVVSVISLLYELKKKKSKGK